MYIIVRNPLESEIYFRAEYSNNRLTTLITTSSS